MYVLDEGEGSSLQSSFFGNNLINNTHQVKIETYPLAMNATWDDGYLSGGNYWSDYDGVDVHYGLYQNETGGDGIGDVHYVIDEQNYDRYPLMRPCEATLDDQWSMFRREARHLAASPSQGPVTNATLWTFATTAEVFTSPSVVRGLVYFGTYDGMFYCLNAATGVQVWNYSTMINDAIWPSPAVNEGRVYFGSRENFDGKLYCLDALNGTVIWIRPLNSSIHSSPLVVDGRIYIETQIHGATGSLSCIEAGTGDVLWSYVTGHYVCSSPAFADDRIYFGSFDDNVYCLDAVNGTRIWSYSTGGDIQSSPTVVGGNVYVGSYDHNVYCFDASNGDVLWNHATGGEVWSCPALAEGRVFVGSNDNNLSCLDALNGTLIWSFGTGEKNSLSNMPTKYFPDGGGLHAGGRSWIIPAGVQSQDRSSPR